MSHSETLRIADLMETSGVKFGTSGARGLATAMTDRVCYAYTTGFLRHLADQGALRTGDAVALAGDLRPSTARILAACSRAVRDAGLVPVNCGSIPTPAVAAYAMGRRIPSLMVTGSHIPDDRNGIKYNRPEGEILKADEAAIREQRVELPDLFDADGGLRVPEPLPAEDATAFREYVARYLGFLPADCLAGLRVALYEHSSVAREALARILTGLGAQAVHLGRSETFIPVDTEAIRPEDVDLARRWAGEVGFDAIVSADGDGDRPLVGDEGGQWLRGDVAGPLVARWLGARTVATPVSSNTVAERSGWFARVVRTRIGSPYVIEAMQRADEGPVVGYEANGGFLVQSEIRRGEGRLAALPTRDAAIVIVGVLLMAREQGLRVSALPGLLPPRHTASDRLKDFPTTLSGARIAALAAGGAAAIEADFGGLGPVADLDQTDGLRITFASGEVVHLRPSGNAPELRCYTEADSPERAAQLTARCLDVLRGWR